jgi:hypothetical protein
VGSQTLTAASSVLSVYDIIWVLKLLLFFAAVTMLVCTIYSVSLWRSIASSASRNPGNPVPSSSPGTNQPPGMKNHSELLYYLLVLWLDFVVQASLRLFSGLGVPGSFHYW